ncbi:MAG: C40 family peptidase [Chromatiaceae bacterium]
MVVNRLTQLGIFAVGLGLQACATTPHDPERVSSLAATRADVVMAALSEVGTRYKYGAEAPGSALDCSGLTQFAYRAAGMRIPRVSMAQRRAATPVDPLETKPGDLVFFRIRPGQHHVGLMVDKRHFVHASSSGRQVRLSDLDKPYWQEHLLGAGTYLK